VPLLPVDVLLVISSGAGVGGDEPSVAEFALAGAFTAVSPASRVFIHRVAVQQNDTAGDGGAQYDRSRRSVGWTDGPNAVFYDVMTTRGAVYAQYTSHYSHVLQLETDCVVLKPGWLSMLVAPVLDRRKQAQQPRFILSGALLGPGQCVYDDVAHRCSELAAQPDYIQRHINGNALYALSRELQTVFNYSLDVYPHWPFDLATWMSARDLSLTHLMLASPHVVNIQQRIDTAAVHNTTQLIRGTRLKADDLVLAHVPFRMRMTALEAALAKLNIALPVTTTFVSASHLEYFSNWVSTAIAAGISNVLVVAFDNTAAATVRSLAPAQYAVLGNLTASNGSTAFKSDDFLALVNRRHAVIRDILSAGFSVFSVDSDCIITGSYMDHLLHLPSDTVYFASDAIASVGYHHYGEPRPRYFFNAGLFFVPKAAITRALSLFTALQTHITVTGRADQDVLNDMVRCTELAACTYALTGTKLGILDPVLFQNGANYFSKQWPSRAALSQALVVHNNWVDGLHAKRFRAQSSQLWTSPTATCASVCVMTQSLALGGNDHSTRAVLATYLQFFAYVRAACLSQKSRRVHMNLLLGSQ